jgi:hypothetical protein
MDVSEDRDGSGARKLVVVLAKSGRSSRVEVPGVDAMSRSALALTLQSQIERAGLDARVRVLEQKIEVEMRDAR